MKKFLSTLIALVLVLTMVVPAAADSPAPGGPFATAFRVQNLEATQVSCIYSLYDGTGAVKYQTATETLINPGDAMYVYTPGVADMPSGAFSGVVSCSGQVAAVTNYSDSNSGASYGGISTPASLWYAPGLYDNYYNYYSTVIVQNATASAVDMKLELFPPGSATAVKTMTATAVPGFASYSFELEGLAELTTNVPYAGKITSTGGDVAPIVTIYGRGAANDQLYTYNPFAAGATTMYAPVLLKNYYGYNSSLVMQNIGTETTHVKVTFSSGATQEQDVASGSAWSLYIPGVAALPSGGAGIFGATIESTIATGGTAAQPLAVLVNESNNYNRAASFTAFSGGSNAVVTPVVLRRYYGYNSSVTCQVISGGPATMTIEYFDTSGSRGTVTSTSVANGQTWLFYQLNDKPGGVNLPGTWIGSAKVTSTAQIACVVNQDMNEYPGVSTVMDMLYAYEGIAAP